MENDYSKFFSTYNNVEPPPYTNINFDTKFDTRFEINPFQDLINPYPSTESDVGSDISLATPLDITIHEKKPKKKKKTVITNEHSERKATGSIKSIMEKKGDIVTDVYNTLIGEGFTSAQACGILGNIMQESSFNVTNHTGDNGNSYGLFQFYKKGELPIYLTWKIRNNINQPEHITLTLFVAHRMKTAKYSAVGIKTATAYNYFNSDDPTKTAEGFNALFEKSADYKHPDRLKNRKKYAKEFYNYFNS